MGMPLPERIKSAPILKRGLELFLNSWMDLNSCRAVGMGTGPVPWLAIQQYAECFEFDDYQREALFHHIGVMDVAYFEYQQKKSKE